MANEKLAALVQELRALKDQKEELDRQLSEIYTRSKELQEVIIPRMMGDGEIEKAKIEGAGTIYIKNVLYVSLTPGDPDTDDAPPFYDWATEHAPDIIKPYIHPKRLQSWAKERLEGGQPLPDNMIKASFLPTATLLRR